MAHNYTLENEIDKLRTRADELWSQIENDTIDLDYIANELTYIANRASQLGETAFAMNSHLTNIDPNAPQASPISSR